MLRLYQLSSGHIVRENLTITKILIATVTTNTNCASNHITIILCLISIRDYCS